MGWPLVAAGNSQGGGTYGNLEDDALDTIFNTSTKTYALKPDLQYSVRQKGVYGETYNPVVRVKDVGKITDLTLCANQIRHPN